MICTNNYAYFLQKCVILIAKMQFCTRKYLVNDNKLKIRIGYVQRKSCQSVARC